MYNQKSNTPIYQKFIYFPGFNIQFHLSIKLSKVDKQKCKTETPQQVSFMILTQNFLFSLKRNSFAFTFNWWWGGSKRVSGDHNRQRLYSLEVQVEQVKNCHWIQVLQMEDTFRLLEHLDDPFAPFLRLTHYSELRAVYSRRGIGSSMQ